LGSGMNFGTSLKERIGQKWKILVLMGIIEGRDFRYGLL